MGEIRIKYSDVQESLSKIQSAVQSLKPNTPKSLGEGNVLESIDKLNSLNQILQQTLMTYQQLIIKNLEGTQKSVKMMQETDEGLVTTMIQR
ncbi:YwqI/YxiC family protein [Fictibacillus norfolkensis]|uniref:YwqI/YxiC family protein n=1 Tax=Fictibacillus norfolkensis TaxID=2762233 RepID=A0ABR8SKI6_9BACL|nr:YwqI/YxiC family protein [Fictibacillus norfolkensis]MBD7963928.1 YwqI/YxiC family protein [Fictibacillus norfolkensis]